jgi:hypothetical protein
MDERHMLAIEDCEERPRDRDRSGKVTLRSGERVCRRSSFEEESSKRNMRISVLEYAGTGAYRARNTKTFVQTPGGCAKASTPKASKAVSTTRIVVQP